VHGWLKTSHRFRWRTSGQIGLLFRNRFFGHKVYHGLTFLQQWKYVTLCHTVKLTFL
jgi:hypothetical protein